MNELKFKNFKCLNAIVGQSKGDNQTVYRYLCTKNAAEIHVIKFFKRNDFYVIKEMSSALVYTGNYFNNESQFESAFDSFDLRKRVSDNIVWYLPKQFICFLAQTKTSRFIECYKYLAKFYRKYYSDLSFISNDFRNKLRERILALKSIMNKELKHFWIGFGTLLGWYRQCGVFSYAGDLDFITLSKFASKVMI